jgi:predicted ferric reductase
MTTMRGQPILRRTIVGLAATLSAAVTGVLIGSAMGVVEGNRMAPRMIARATGISAYLLLVLLVVLGLLLSRPSRTRVARPSPATRIRLHIVLAALTLALTIAHIVVLATDRFAGVGWRGASLPMQSAYRPAAVTLGVLGAWAGLVVGSTALLAGHLPQRLWWRVHKVAIVALLLVWLHGVLAGGDTAMLRWLYLSTGGLIAVVALSRYAARTPAEQIADREADR